VLDCILPVSKFLFWNINGKPLTGLVGELAEIQGIDVIILAECDTDPSIVLSDLNTAPRTGFHFPLTLCPRIVVFTRFAPEFLQPAFESERLSIRRLSLPNRRPILLVTAHLPSKLHCSEESQKFGCVDLANRIGIEEEKVGHRRTILVGDFNMNPFESGLVSFSGLNSTMSRRIASRQTRTVQGSERQFFYNPMWSLFGDAEGETAGSFFFDAGQDVNYYWNIFDQVLLRPELAEHFERSRLRIVKTVGPISLVQANGRPDKRKGSDHLPLLFEVEF
jgi:endonuclease/exonuclease/phosphatase family metal-dependent hydrolase